MLAGLRKVLPVIDPAARAQTAVSAEADELEDFYGVEAIAWVRAKILKAPKGARARLYRVHDELARRRLPGPVLNRH